jgi:hypothetical protein
MNSARPTEGATVWIEYPESKWVRAIYSSPVDSYKIRNRKLVPADEIVNWSLHRPNKHGPQQPQSWLARIGGGLLQIILDMF